MDEGVGDHVRHVALHDALGVRNVPLLAPPANPNHGLPGMTLTHGRPDVNSSNHRHRQNIESEPMHDQFSNTQEIRKPAVTSRGGIVAAQSGKAAAVGAEVLAAGGDCVDAVIATTFALGVLEPWMSGLGGGGAMVLYRAREDRYEVIDYGMRAPRSLRVEDYPLTGDGAAASDLFPWARVKDDRNIHGPASIAVPGVVAGMEEAHRRHAKLSWKELLAPSVTLAGEGLGVD